MKTLVSYKDPEAVLIMLGMALLWFGVVFWSKRHFFGNVPPKISLLFHQITNLFTRLIKLDIAFFFFRIEVSSVMLADSLTGFCLVIRFEEILVLTRFFHFSFTF